MDPSARALPRPQREPARLGQLRSRVLYRVIKRAGLCVLLRGVTAA